MKKKNILYINHYAGSPKHGMEYRPYYLCKHWIKLGHDVTIIAASYSHLRRKNVNTNGLNKIIELIDGIKYIFINTNKYSKNNILRLFNIFIFVFRVFSINNFIHKYLKPDIVISSCTYPLDIFVAYNIAKKSSAKLVFEIHDLGL